MRDFSDFFGPEGTLAVRLAHFSYREAQQQMAQWVAAAIDAREHLVVEAGTGIGKTFAYLLPALLSGRQVVISTATRTLQDQLFARDLPALGAAVGRPVDVVQLKGRSNYLCRHRLAVARAEGSLDAPLQSMLDSLGHWSRQTIDGDLTELEISARSIRCARSSPRPPTIASATAASSTTNASSSAARRRAQAADIVIVNHHLLLSDLALKETGFGELLPDADAVIVDEAHQLPDIAQQFFGAAVSSRELERLARDTLAEAHVRGPASPKSA